MSIFILSLLDGLVQVDGHVSSNNHHYRVEKHPSDNFTIVINPASGPGSGTLPDSNWIREITKLNSYKNVQSIGYVAVTYGKRPLEAVIQDINHYAQWASGDQGLVIQGVFIDEVPNIVDEHNVGYVRSIGQAVKKIPQMESGGIGEILFDLFIHECFSLASPFSFQSWNDRGQSNYGTRQPNRRV